MQRPPQDHQAGASVIEYALLMALIALVCVVALDFFGSARNSSLERSASSITAGD